MSIKKRDKILLIASPGGHMIQLKKLFSTLDKNKSYCWISLRHEFIKKSFQDEKIYFIDGPTNRNFQIMIINLFHAMKVFKIEKPDILISTGAGICIPFFVIGWILGRKLIFIESYSRVNELSLSGKILYYLADEFFVQWKELQYKYPKALYMGSLL